MLKNESKPANVIDLSSARFPIGSKVWHDLYRICKVADSRGSQRLLRTPMQGKLGMEFIEIIVHVNELKQLLDISYLG